MNGLSSSGVLPHPFVGWGFLFVAGQDFLWKIFFDVHGFSVLLRLVGVKRITKAAAQAGNCIVQAE